MDYWTGVPVGCSKASNVSNVFLEKWILKLVISKKCLGPGLKNKYC